MGRKTAHAIGRSGFVRFGLATIRTLLLVVGATVLCALMLRLGTESPGDINMGGGFLCLVLEPAAFGTVGYLTAMRERWRPILFGSLQVALGVGISIGLFAMGDQVVVVNFEALFGQLPFWIGAGLLGMVAGTHRTRELRG